MNKKMKKKKNRKRHNEVSIIFAKRHGMRRKRNQRIQFYFMHLVWLTSQADTLPHHLAKSKENQFPFPH